jgi:hypothetical protein
MNSFVGLSELGVCQGELDWVVGAGEMCSSLQRITQV